MYAALEVATGRVLGACTPRHTADDFLRFLQQVSRTYRGRELHIVLDNSSTHGTAAVHAWLAAHPRVHLHFTPKAAAWLNMVEAWFSFLTRKSLRRGSFDTVRALIAISSATLPSGMRIPPPSCGPDPADIIKKAIRRP